MSIYHHMNSLDRDARLDLADLAAGRPAHRTIWSRTITPTQSVQRAADAVPPPEDTDAMEREVLVLRARAQQASDALFAAWPVGPNRAPAPFPSELYAAYSAAAQEVNSALARIELAKRAASYALMDLSRAN